MKPSDLVLRLRTYAHMEHIASSWGFSRSGMVMELAADLIEKEIVQKDQKEWPWQDSGVEE